MDGKAIFFTRRGGAGRGKAKNLWGGAGNQGWMPRPAGMGGGPRPAPPRKNDQNRGEVAGQNKGPESQLSPIEETNDGTILQQ